VLLACEDQGRGGIITESLKTQVKLTGPRPPKSSLICCEYELLKTASVINQVKGTRMLAAVLIKSQM